MRKTSVFMLTVFLSSILLSSYGLALTPESNYVIDGDTVYIDDSNVFISVSPHTTRGGWVYVDFISKRYDGEIDFLLGFNRDISYPYRAEYYNPHYEVTDHSYVIPDQYFSNTTYFKADYTFSSQDQNWIYDGEVFLWSKIDWGFNGSEIVLDDWVLVYSQQFDRAHKNTKTIYWSTSKYVEWVKLTKKKRDWKIINYDYQGFDKWYYFKHNVNEDQTYSMRIWIDVIPYVNGGSGKFWIAIKPSSETFKQALQNNHLYSLDPWWNNDWDYARKITVDHTKIDSNLTDFPVMVYLNSSRVEWIHIQDDLDDLRFVANDNSTVLKYEIENYIVDANATLWVKTNASSVSDTVFYLYYGNSGASSGEDAESVWDSNFKLVTHMVDNTTSTVLDSTSNDNDGTKKGANEPIEATGIIDKAQDFDRTDDYIEKASCTINPPNYITLEAWINVENLPSGTHASILSKGFTILASPYEQYSLLIERTTQTLIFRVTTDDDVRHDFDSGFTPSTSTWYYVVGLYDGVKMYVYVDALSKGTPPSQTGNLGQYTSPLRIGDFAWGGHRFEGLIDELRISNLNRSSAWINASYYGGSDQLLSFQEYVKPSVPTVTNYNPVYLMTYSWVALLGLALWKSDLMFRGVASVIGFVLGLTIHSIIESTLGTLLGVVVVMINVGLLVSVLFEK